MICCFTPSRQEASLHFNKSHSYQASLHLERLHLHSLNGFVQELFLFILRRLLCCWLEEITELLDFYEAVYDLIQTGFPPFRTQCTVTSHELSEIAARYVREKVPSTLHKPEGREDRGCVEPLSTVASWSAKPSGQNSVNFCLLTFTGQESSASNWQEKASREHRQHCAERKHCYTFPRSFRATPRAHAAAAQTLSCPHKFSVNCHLSQQQGRVPDKQRIEYS